MEKIWQNGNMIRTCNASIGRWSIGVKISTGKGCRLIITHIRNEAAFVEGGLNVFVSKKTGYYHENINSQVFEQ